MGSGGNGEDGLDALLGGRVLDPALWTDPGLAVALTARLEQIARALAWSRWRLRLGGTDALAVANKVLADLPRARYRGEATVARFLARCVEFTFLNHLRDEGGEPGSLPDGWEGARSGDRRLGSGSPPPDPPAAADSHERSIAIRRCLEELGSPCRELLLDYYGSGTPDPSVLGGVGGGTARGTLYQRVWRCRERFRDLLVQGGLWEAEHGR